MYFSYILSGGDIMFKLKLTPEMKGNDDSQPSKAWLTAVGASSLPHPASHELHLHTLQGAVFPLALGVGFIRLSFVIS